MRSIRIYASALFVFGITLTFNNCGEVSFQKAEGIQESFSTLPNGNNVYQVSQALTSTQTRPLDIVWVIDNSGSMAAEAAHVRNNLQSFVSQLNGIPDVKMALLSQAGTTGTSVSLPALSVPNMQLDQNVSSTNGLYLLANALCPSSSPGNCANVGVLNPSRGAFSSFLRPNSQKVVVMVTDDESAMAKNDFLSAYNSLYAGSSLTLFGWIGLGSASPCQARTGTVYMELAAATGGQIFNICDTDWSARFSQLASNVVTLVVDTIPLPQVVLQSSQIFMVKLNGRVLSSSEYSFNTNGIVLSAAVRNGLSVAQLYIEYQ